MPGGTMHQTESSGQRQCDPRPIETEGSPFGTHLKIS